MRKPIIAIDGPAGSGKSTTAGAVARALGFAHVDSGALYRASTLIALEQGTPPETWTAAAIVERCRAKPVTVRTANGFNVLIAEQNAEPSIRSKEVTGHVSLVSAMPPVRDYVNAMLREAAKDGAIVMDGRDIGTVVFPDAEVKIFMVADPAERARRRLSERGHRIDRTSIESEAQAITARDAYDSGRDVAPLAMAEGATVIDTTQMGFDEQVALVVELARKAASEYP